MLSVVQAFLALFVIQSPDLHPRRRHRFGWRLRLLPGPI